MNPINAAKAQIQEMKNTIPGLNKLPLNMAMPGADKLPGADQKQALPVANDKLAMANLPANLLGMAGGDKVDLATKKDLLLSLEAINGLVNLMQKMNQDTTTAPGTTAASSATTVAPSSTTAAPATTAAAATTTASTATTAVSSATTAAASATTAASSA